MDYESMCKELNLIYLNSNLNEEQRTHALEEKTQKFIRTILKSTDINDTCKVKSIQKLMLWKYSENVDECNQKIEKSKSIEYPELTDKNITYYNEELKEFGCQHYKRNCCMLCPTCKEWFTCRLCHDNQVYDHKLDRYSVQYIACMNCKTIQKPSNECIQCHIKFGEYYCDICHFWRDLTKPSFHCPYCKLCRQGKGLGIDTYHCMKCDNCIKLLYKDNHSCYPGYLHGDCPVCFESLNQSTSSVIELPCKHNIHYDCMKRMLKESNYTCPLCKKSMIDMSETFDAIDQFVEMQPMPEPYCHQTQVILCNDCGHKNKVPYHFIYHKCPNPECLSYNTQVINSDEVSQDFDRKINI